MNYVAYYRKSTESEDRQILSIPAQKREIESLAKLRGIKIIDSYEESKSAKQPGRSEFNKMLDGLEAKEATGILTWKLDRLARNPVDGGRLQWMLQTGVISSIMTPEREYRTGDNVLIMNVELGMANQYVLDLSKNIKRGNQQRALNGLPNNPVPLGYLNLNGQVVKDPESFDLMRQLWDLALTGKYTVADLTRIADEQLGIRTIKRKKIGGNPPSKSMLHKLFRNTFFYGRFKQSGGIYNGSYPPMITEEEFEKVQYILNGRSYRKPQKHEFAFTGLIKCGCCGGYITAEEKTKYYESTNNLAHYSYYRCGRKMKHIKCQEKPIQTEELEKQIVEVLAKIEISDKAREWCLKYFGEFYEKEVSERTERYKSNQQKYNQLQREIDNLTKMRYKDLITDEEYLSQKKELVNALEDAKELLEDVEARAKRWLELSENTFSLANRIQEKFNKGSLEDKRDILQAIGLNFVLKDKKLIFELKKPFQIISERPNDNSWWS